MHSHINALLRLVNALQASYPQLAVKFECKPQHIRFQAIQIDKAGYSVIHSCEINLPGPELSETYAKINALENNILLFFPKVAAIYGFVSTPVEQTSKAV